MSFSINARGTREEVVASLESLTKPQLGTDEMGADLRDLFVEFISRGTDLEPPADQRYSVSASGHSSHGGVTTLTAKIELVPFPYPDQPNPSSVNVPLAEQASATDNLV